MDVQATELLERMLWCRPSRSDVRFVEMSERPVQTTRGCEPVVFSEPEGNLHQEQELQRFVERLGRCAGDAITNSGQLLPAGAGRGIF